jgi:molybdate transport system substrate-binding protein
LESPSRVARLVSLSALACLAACSRQAPVPAAAAARIELSVYAATSARDALQALAPDYEGEHAVDLVFNFGSSGDLSKQVVAAGKADVFLSADEKEMDRVEQAQLVLQGTRRALLSNQLALIEPGDGPSAFTAPFEPGQLAGDKV